MVWRSAPLLYRPSSGGVTTRIRVVRGEALFNTFLYWELLHAGVASPPNTYQVSDRFLLEAATSYYWRVRPRIQGDGTPVTWSDVWNFRTE